MEGLYQAYKGVAKGDRCLRLPVCTPPPVTVLDKEPASSDLEVWSIISAHQYFYTPTQGPSVWAPNLESISE